jgi:hypothetical protein
MLDIILRTCASASVPAFGPAALNPHRICGDDKDLMIRKCLTSLVGSINHCDHDIKLIILDDHSGAAFLKKMKAILDTCDKPYEIVSLEKKGFNNSAYQQFLYARNARELAYTVEDDYLHTPDALNEMLYAYYHFKARVGFNDVAIYPFDCDHRYKVGQERPCKIFYRNNRYWRTNLASSNTLFAHRDIFQRYFPVFETLALEYPSKDESDTINRLYNNLVDCGGPVTLFTPIPSLAVHLTYDEPLEITTAMFDWREIWDSITVKE